ncbi:hypothetical protein M6I34_06175 [Burkholderiaceae bacterium FT117]|uniref:hypothetical protein n=1 Tax=Zeimonas sediminis TaxID=2944268 RepID=UPI0023431C07|nr:hypothetical protein [Zeimonas sediminis]MCM5570088.1 hypothetical protein [Zeimonas sediminis]
MKGSIWIGAIALAAAGAFTTIAGAAPESIRTETVRFERGASGAVVEDTITGRQIVDYVLRAREGQSMNVSMATDNGANYFNILAPGEGEVALFNGSTSENQFEGVLPRSGDYRIRVYLMPSAARRHEAARYRLEMIVSGPARASGARAGATATAAPSTSGSDADLGRAIRKTLGGDWEANYFDARVDLDGDGTPEVVAMVAGPMVCGTGGCPVLVFTPSPDGLRLVSRISVSRPPVAVSSRSSHGWRNLIVTIGGGGIPSGSAELRFDGRRYPFNPTVPPALAPADLASGEVLIPEFRSFRDGKPLPAAAAE